MDGRGQGDRPRQPPSRTPALASTALDAQSPAGGAGAPGASSSGPRRDDHGTSPPPDGLLTLDDLADWGSTVGPPELPGARSADSTTSDSDHNLDSHRDYASQLSSLREGTWSAQVSLQGRDVVGRRSASASGVRPRQRAPGAGVFPAAAAGGRAPAAGRSGTGAGDAGMAALVARRRGTGPAQRPASGAAHIRRLLASPSSAAGVDWAGKRLEVLFQPNAPLSAAAYTGSPGRARAAAATGRGRSKSRRRRRKGTSDRERGVRSCVPTWDYHAVRTAWLGKGN
jgi:hypothetical protein